jgi:hypothetical protein
MIKQPISHASNEICTLVPGKKPPTMKLSTMVPLIFKQKFNWIVHQIVIMSSMLSYSLCLCCAFADVFQTLLTDLY